MEKIRTDMVLKTLELLTGKDRLKFLERAVKGEEILRKTVSISESTDELIFYADPSAIMEYSNEELDEILEFLTLQVELLEQFKKDIPIKSNLLNGKGELNRTL